VAGRNPLQRLSTSLHLTEPRPSPVTGSPSRRPREWRSLRSSDACSVGVSGRGWWCGCGFRGVGPDKGAGGQGLVEGPARGLLALVVMPACGCQVLHSQVRPPWVGRGVTWSRSHRVAVGRRPAGGRCRWGLRISMRWRQGGTGPVARVIRADGCSSRVCRVVKVRVRSQSGGPVAGGPSTGGARSPALRRPEAGHRGLARVLGLGGVPRPGDVAGGGVLMGRGPGGAGKAWATGWPAGPGEGDAPLAGGGLGEAGRRGRGVGGVEGAEARHVRQANRSSPATPPRGMVRFTVPRNPGLGVGGVVGG